MSKLKELNPHKNEIVRIKFKKIEEIVKNRRMDFHEAEEHYSIGDNVKAYINGGDFVVANVVDEDEDIPCITVKNHYDHNASFYIYDDVIESIDIVQDAERFYSADLHLLVIRIEDELFINGQPLIWDEDVRKANHNYDQKNRSKEPKPYENENRRLLKIFENYIADLAVRESFKDMGEE